MKAFLLLSVGVLAATATPAIAATTLPTITGTLQFGTTGGPNYFNPVYNFVPAGYGNSSSDIVTVGSVVEFGFRSASNLDTADFTSNSLTITDQVTTTSLPFFETFTSSVPGYFAGATLTSSTFTGATFTVLGNTLSFNSLGATAPGTQTATFTFGSIAAAAPEPGTWLMMIVGFGLAGTALRRRKAVRTTVSYAA